LWRFWQRSEGRQSGERAAVENEGGSTPENRLVVGRPLMLASLLGASIGVPYVVSKTSTPTQGPGAIPNTPTAAPAAAPATAWQTAGVPATRATTPPSLLSQATNFFNPSPQPAPALSGYPTTATPAPLAPISGPPAVQPIRYHSFQETLRFDVSKEWVYQNWDRKSTGLSDPQMFGIRVPLVTGTQRTDLAGSLTYMFDAQGQVQHISLRGRTADTTALVQFLTQTYQFQRMQAPAGEQLYQVRTGNNVYSELRTMPESVLLETSPLGSFGVVLELGRPGSNRPLQPQIPKLDIPEVATPAKPAEEAAKTSAADGKEDPNLYGSLRPATQVEHNQVFEHRWPN
jgi:hypothetical protein